MIIRPVPQRGIVSAVPKRIISKVSEREYARMMADGIYYNDLRTPWITGAVGQVTLATTDKALYTPSNFPALGGSYFSFIGKKIKIRLFGQMTTGATPGNGTFDIYLGNGTDANGTILASSGTLALSANATNLSWMCEIFVSCRTIGSTGTLFVTGYAQFNVGILASTLEPMLIPASAAAASGSVDLTAANIISIQFKRSGNTAETMQVLDMEVTALN